MSEYDALLRDASEVEDGVTAGPWEHDTDTDCNIIGHSYLRRGRHIDTMRHADAAFIARSRTLVPELAAALRASEAKREAAEDAIREVLPLLENAEYEVGRRYYGDDIRLEAALECLEKSIKILKEKVKYGHDIPEKYNRLSKL